MIVNIESYISSVRFVAREMFEVDWREYGNGFKLVDDEGNQKYQSYYFVGSNPRTGVFFDEKVETVPDIAIAAKTLTKKFIVLEQNPRFVASIQGRDPENGFWGGAHRSSVDPTFILGGTGLPELVDNLLETNCARTHGILTETDYLIAVSYENDYIQQACRHVGMSEEQYAYLKHFVEKTAS